MVSWQIFQCVQSRVFVFEGTLLLLGTTAASSLGSLNSLLVTLSRAALEALHEASSRLERTLEVTGGGLAKDVNLDQVGLESALERNNGLDQERVGVLEVEVHESHHADTHELGAEELLDLLGVVGVDGGGHELALLSRSHGRWLNILEGRQVCSNVLVSPFCYSTSRKTYAPCSCQVIDIPFFLLIWI
jgi:hypothetical protein